jgi:hypothetical protein
LLLHKCSFRRLWWQVELCGISGNTSLPSFLPSLESSNSTHSSERNRQFSHAERGEEEEFGAKER